MELSPNSVYRILPKEHRQRFCHKVLRLPVQISGYLTAQHRRANFPDSWRLHRSMDSAVVVLSIRLSIFCPVYPDH